MTQPLEKRGGQQPPAPPKRPPPPLRLRPKNQTNSCSADLRHSVYASRRYVNQQRNRYTAHMLFMVIERFKNGDALEVGERFRKSGRMLPPDVAYQASWVDPVGGRCFQVMEAASRELLNTWTSRWEDLIHFEIVPVQTSCEFWSLMNRSEKSK